MDPFTFQLSRAVYEEKLQQPIGREDAPKRRFSLRLITAVLSLLR